MSRGKTEALSILCLVQPSAAASRTHVQDENERGAGEKIDQRLLPR